MLFKKKYKHEHEFENLGLFYKERLTEYRNCFDEIKVYRKEQCRLCGCIQDVLLSSEEFIPELYEGRDDRKDSYIKHLIDRNIKLEIDL